MRALVIGASGLVGSALMRRLGTDAVGTYRSRLVPGLVPLDATDPPSVKGLLAEVEPETVFFPAAVPNVDWCESHPEESRTANVVSATIALHAAQRAGAVFVYYSSEYVFDGTDGPYDETRAPAPLSVYGRQKLEVEERVLHAGGTVIRTTVVFGPEPSPARNFALALVARLRAGERVDVPSDQVSTPTWADDLASASVDLAGSGDIWHVAGPKLLSRSEFGLLVARAFALDTALIRPTPTARLGQVAPRPLRGGLVTDKLARRIGSLLEPRVALARLAAHAT